MKREIATYISQHARPHVYRFTEHYGNIPDRTARMRDLLMNPEDSIPIINSPDSIWMFVVSGSGQRIGAITGPVGRITKK
jgi:hypothetical protein